MRNLACQMSSPQSRRLDYSGSLLLFQWSSISPRHQSKSTVSLVGLPPRSERSPWHIFQSGARSSGKMWDMRSQGLQLNHVLVSLCVESMCACAEWILVSSAPQKVLVASRVEKNEYTPAYVSIRQHTKAYVRAKSERAATAAPESRSANTRQHTSAYVSIRKHTSERNRNEQRQQHQSREAAPTWLSY